MIIQFLVLCLPTSMYMSEVLPSPSPEPYSLEWYYRLGDYFTYDDENYNFTVNNCGTFVGYYQFKMYNDSNFTNEIENSCNFLNPTDILSENRCNTTLIKAEYKNEIFNVKCKSTNESCSFDKICKQP